MMRVAIVNDSPVALESLRRTVARDARLTLAWNGEEAVARCRDETPDLILMDMLMPGMDGVECTRRIMAETPCPILVVTATVTGNAGRVFQALAAGALDAINTPTQQETLHPGESPLLRRIAMLGVLTGRMSNGQKSQAAEASPREGATPPRDLVVVGASAGGPGALAILLGGLSADFPGALVVLQHLDHQFTPGLAQWLSAQSPLPVVLSRPGEVPRPGAVTLIHSTRHMVFTRDGRLEERDEPQHAVHRPSIDALFTSVAQYRPERGVGVLLTGMGEDGARGLKAMREAGCPTLAQGRAGCPVYGMPGAAVRLGAVEQDGSLAELARTLTSLARRGVGEPTQPPLREGESGDE